MSQSVDPDHDIPGVSPGLAAARIDRIPEDEWRRLFDRYNGQIIRIADVVDARPRTVRRKLDDIGLVDTGTIRPYNVEKLLPDDLGLSPLNCGGCGRTAIETHPCPKCGFSAGGFECETCGRNFDSRAELKVHKQAMAQEFTVRIDSERRPINLHRFAGFE